MREEATTKTHMSHFISRTHRLRIRTVLTTWHNGVTEDSCVSRNLFMVENRRSWMRKCSTHCDSQNLVRHLQCARLTKLWYQQVVKIRGRYGLLCAVTSSASAIQQISDAIAQWCALFAVKWHLLVSSRSVWKSGDAFSSDILQTVCVVHTRKKVSARTYGKDAAMRNHKGHGCAQCIT